ncbi:MAG: triose-phosphate isomerase [Candidatus Altiarchaeota archaeon]
MKDGLIALNMKVYEQSTGDGGFNIAKLCDDVASESGADFVVCPSSDLIFRVCQEVDIPVFAQHVDNCGFGSHTGRLLPEAALASGASGSLINHSERRLQLADIEALVERLRALKMTSIVCSNNIATTKAIAALEPDYVAIEPPELIGSGISVSAAQPELITGSVDAVKEVSGKVKVLTGAGISTGEDVKKALELGTVGVLLASGVVKAKDPRIVLLDLVAGLE